MADEAGGTGLSRDEQKLAELGYKQELDRGWSRFANFAISFSIISVLAGCFTVYGQAWNNGGPIAISIGWPVVAAIILTVAFSMSELASAFPTAGGPYWWAHRLGGPGWSWFTGWFNVLGLLGIVASVDYVLAFFFSSLFGLWGWDLGFVNFADSRHVLSEIFWLFAIILVLHAMINIFSSHLVALLSSISVFWHVVGVAIIIGILAFAPKHHQSFDFVFTQRLNNSGFSMGMFWWYILPTGFLLTMYTITGYDASAHVAEETHEAEEAAAKGVWQSVFISAVIGWFVLLAITFAATDTKAINEAAGSSISVFTSADMNQNWAEAIIFIACVGQFFCGMACVTSCSRTFFAFSRDRAIPGHQLWSRVNAKGVPVMAVVGSCALAFLLVVPALPGRGAFVPPVAFFAVTSIGTIGLYIAYVTPVYLRWRKGDDFETGSWTLGSKYKWMNPIAVVWTCLMVIVFCLPIYSTGVPWESDYDWNSLNYTPLVVGVVGVGIALAWFLGMNKRYTGPIRQIEFDDAMGVKSIEDAPAPAAGGSE
ncbi:MAG TPA: amino acid permease [Thermoleophilaceae bacterium]|jgi:amino acid transporter